MFGRKCLIPFQLVVLVDFVLVVAHFAAQRLVRSRAAFHKPSTQTLMMDARNVAGTVAGLDQGLVTFTVVANPAFSFIQESFVVFGTFACKFAFWLVQGTDGQDSHKPVVVGTPSTWDNSVSGHFCWSNLARSFLGFRIHNSDGCIQFQRTAGNLRNIKDSYT